MILIFEQDLTHYRAAFYDFLAKQVNERILVLYGKSEPGSSHIIKLDEKNKNFSSREIKRKWFSNKIYIQSFKQIKKIVETNTVTCVIHRGAIRNVGLLREILFFRKKGIPVILRGIGFSVRRKFNPKKNIVDKYHKLIINKSNAYLCYTEGSKSILDRHYNSRKIIVAVNTLNSEIISNHFSKLKKEGKVKIKKELNLKKERYIIHIGRLSKRKKIDKLIDIYRAVKEVHEDLGLIIIGDGPEKDKLLKKVDNLNDNDILFTGSISSENILTSKYIFASDVVVIPGNIGLLINHSFLLGKPVIGHILPKNIKPPKDYIHGPEHEYLIDKYNGLIITNPALNNFKEAVLEIFKHNSYADNALKYAYENLTVQKMAEGYLNAIKYVKEHVK